MFFDHSKESGDLFFRIGQQREGQAELLLKLLLRCSGILRNAEQDHACFPDGRVAVTKAASFFSAAGRVGFGIEIEHHRFAPKIFQGNLFAVLVRRTKVWGFIIDFHGIFSSPYIVISHWAVWRHLGGGNGAGERMVVGSGSDAAVRAQSSDG
jgi:hypothetical protein